MIISYLSRKFAFKKFGWRGIYLVPYMYFMVAFYDLQSKLEKWWNAPKKNTSTEHERLRVLAGIKLTTPKSNTSEPVRYNITNSGSLEIDAEALVNSEGWKRQVAAVKRLKDIQDVSDSIVTYNITDSRFTKDDQV